MVPDDALQRRGPWQLPHTPPASPLAALKDGTPQTTDAQIDDYDGELDAIRRAEYPQLTDPAAGGGRGPKTVYLDHAGSTVCSASFVRAQAAELLGTVPANPHSRHAESQWTQARIDQARDRLLAFLGTSSEQYAVVFTANATAAIRLAFEIAPVTADGAFCFTRESHTSVVGIRGLAAARGIRVCPAEFDNVKDIVAPHNACGTSLLAYPAQCNFSGDRFSLDVADRVAQAYADGPGEHPPWWVLVDAAAFAASSPLHLDRLPTGPDFVALSMYKIFGAPTGLGALLIRRSSVPHLRTRAYFGGGTVAGLAFDEQWQVPRSDVESQLEDGTVNYHGILALHHALDAHAKIYQSMERVARHTQSVAAYARSALRSLAHSNGRSVCEVYCRGDEPGSTGPTVAFNVRDQHGACVGFVEVERLAVMAGISLRSGRFCNPGAAQRWLELSAADLARHTSMGVVCGDDHDLVDGRPVGALRVSFGAMTSKQDIDALVAFLDETFRDYGRAPDIPAAMAAASSAAIPRQVEVDAVVIYPIKSCHGWTVPRNTAWDITPQGLRFDRSFVIMRENSAAPMQQKRYPRMAVIRPHIDLVREVLVLRAPGHPPLDVSLRPQRLLLEDAESRACGTRVLAQRVRSEQITAWLSSVLAISCYLACEPRLLLSDEAGPADAVACVRRPTLAFSNQAQLLLVTQESAKQVERWVAEAAGPDSRGANIGPKQFRPNLIVRSSRSGSQSIAAFDELQWASVVVDGARFDVAGPCRRCQMISVDQDSAQKLKEPYSTLARRMRVDGKIGRR
ncbi:hypothetical protein H4R19_002382 [Coemansia spiralis]|nr:hypothetical protein H4R19_002382 [Coemansia spiralis]